MLLHAVETFIGQHVRATADVSTKVIPKEGPFDRLGNLVLIDGKKAIIEYSDLPAELAEQRDAEGNLLISAGNPAIHIFSLAFLQRVTGGASDALPYHLARKKVPYWDTEKDAAVEPKTENALKFERFIFDVLPLAQRWVAVATSRREEFFPLKNATGADSPEVVKRAISDLAADWLRRAGAEVAAGVTVEVSPLAALEPADIGKLIAPGQKIESPTYFN